MQRDDERAGVLAWGRALVLALVALLTGAVAHASAGGLLPDATTLLVATLVTAAACRPWLSGPASSRRIVALTIVGQSAIHLGLSLTAGHRPPPHAAAAGHGAHGAHGAHGVHGEGTGGGEGALTHLLTDLTGPDAPMVLLHLVAAAAVGLWLARGEQALWLLLRTVWQLVALPRVAVGAPPTASVPVHVPPPPASLRLRALASSLCRRGPPVLLAT